MASKTSDGYGSHSATQIKQTDGKSASRASNVSTSSEVTIQRFHPPAGFDLVVFFGIGALCVGFLSVKLGLVEPGTYLWRTMESSGLPCEPARFKSAMNLAFVPAAGIHAVEMWWLHRSRLAKYGPALGSTAWLLWMGSCFFEGLFAFRRFDRLVAELKKKDVNR